MSTSDTLASCQYGGTVLFNWRYLMKILAFLFLHGIVITSPLPNRRSTTVLTTLTSGASSQMSGNVSNLRSLVTTTKSSLTSVTPAENYLNRLDFISVVVICAIVAICFAICVLVGCRRKKRHPSPRDTVDARSSSEVESRAELRPNAGRNVNPGFSTSDPRAPESPPPTYSILERQTSFTSYVSQTSSQIEIPPDYDEAVEIDDTVSGQSSQSQQGSRTSAIRGASSRESSNGSSARPNRSESARARGPPRARAHRSSSDGGRPRRQRMSNRPTTVTEDEVSIISSTTNGTASNITNLSIPESNAVSADDVNSSVSVTVEINSQSHIADSMEPLLARNSGTDEGDDRGPVQLHSEPGRNNRKLTLV